jgi:hypothetical protein
MAARHRVMAAAASLISIVISKNENNEMAKLFAPHGVKSKKCLKKIMKI